jgi:hypothetical protein
MTGLKYLLWRKTSGRKNSASAPFVHCNNRAETHDNSGIQKDWALFSEPEDVKSKYLL